jgi:prepilin-type N-terminal cleavage/methylation domain-containing protein
MRYHLNRSGSSEGSNRAAGRRGFTLLEVLIALTITLILMTLVVQVFQFVSDGVFYSRANMEMNDQLRNCRQRLISDLRGSTALTIPPIMDTWGVGYFEYLEGETVSVMPGGDLGFRPTGTVGAVSGTPIMFTEYGDRDDILMFTSVSYEGDFIGRVVIGAQPTGLRSKFAEIAWYPHVIVDAANANQQLMTLRRRQQLISNVSATSSAQYDSSTRNLLGMGPSTNLLRPVFPAPTGRTIGGSTAGNTLESLTRREHRFQHQGNPAADWGVAGSPHRYPQTNHRITTTRGGITVAAFPTAPFDFTSLSLQTVNEQAASGVDKGEWNMVTAASRTFREADDIVLSHVIGFDVKAWDPGAPVFRVVADTENPELVGCVVPGDPGYLPALKKFIFSPGTAQNQPVTFGAYADLNYMGNLAAQSSFTYAVTSTAFPINRYSIALATINPNGALPSPYFGGPGELSSMHAAVRDGSFVWTPATYDTYSRHYEYDGISTITTTTNGLFIVPTSKRLQHYTNDLLCDPGTNCIDDNGNGLIDEPYERDGVPPYEKPLRGIRVSIRAMEPDSKAVREVTVVHEFLPL